MKYLPLLWAGLRRRPARSILTLLSLVIAFLLVGLMTGLDASLAQFFDRARIDRIIVVARFGGPLPIGYVEQIQRLDGVTEIAPSGVVGGYYQEPRNPVAITMTDARAARLQPEWNISAPLFAKLKRVQTGLIVSQMVAERYRWREGDVVPVQSPVARQDGAKLWTFNVVAIVPDNEFFPVGFAVGNYAYLDQARAEGKGTVRDIRLLVGDAGRAVQTGNAIEALFANSAVPVTALPERIAYETALSRVMNIDFFTRGVSAAALFMILFLTRNVIAQAVRERIPEFAVMKTMGFSERGISALVLTEAACLCLIGAGLGLLLAQATPNLLRRALPPTDTLLPVITPGVVAGVLICALVVAAVSGLPVVWRLRRLSIANALIEGR
jgi:putative ABC transport system permease protein